LKSASELCVTEKECNKPVKSSTGTFYNYCPLIECPEYTKMDKEKRACVRTISEDPKFIVDK
jgi:hypothetical protein